MRGQSSTEFVLLASFMMLVFIIFFVLIQQKIVRVADEKTAANARQVLDTIVNEIKLAESVTDDYYREFVLPNDINGIEYTVDIIQGPGETVEVVAKYSGKEQVYFLEELVDKDSTVGIGLNTITKKDGKILIKKIIP
jgi:hypothetical protein